MGLSEFLEKRRIKIYSAISALIFVLLFPALLALLTPIYILRFIVSKLKFIFNPNLDKLVPNRSVLIALDEWDSNPKWNLVVWLVADGNMSLDSFKETFRQKIFQVKNPDGTFLDPEYQQFYSKWLGFLFWEWDRTFKLDQHFRELSKRNDGVTSETELKEILKKQMWKPFQPRKSPWEFLLIRNYQSDSDGNKCFPKSVIIHRIHHGLCDGTKIIRVLLQDMNNISVELNAKPTFVRKSKFERAMDLIRFPVVAPYQLFSMIYQAKDDNDWHRLNDTEFSKPFSLGFSKRISMKYIHGLKDYHKVTFTAVVMSAVVGGIRRTMTRMRVPVPETISAITPVPYGKHPNRLRNHFIIALIPLPIGITDPYKRLMKTQENLNNHKSSFVNQFTYYTIPLTHALFHWMVKPIGNNQMSTILFSNFAGPVNPLKFIAGGGEDYLTDINFSGGTGTGKVGLAFGLLSYAGGIRIVTHSDKSILPDDLAVDQLSNDIITEFQTLSQSTSVLGEEMYTQ